jgi:hypothetical protein
MKNFYPFPHTLSALFSRLAVGMSISLPYSLFAILYSSFLFSCNQDHNNHDHHATQTPTGQPAPETLAMIDSVQKAQNAIDPQKITVFLCAQRAQMLRQRAEQTDGLNRLNFSVMWGFEELKAGNSAEAIRIFDEVLKMASTMEIPGKEQTMVEVKKLKALSALRLAEQENCILNHTIASCIIPIAPAGQHQKKQGSELAMEVYQDILKSSPGDLTSLWLLNIAAMTLGQFPDGVPASMRLPAGYFSPKVDFPMWTDIAGSMGLDRRGLAGGVAIEDFDRDGDLDIMATKWGFHDQIHYYQNKGDGSFEDISTQAGLKGVTGGLNIRQTDYNNDGYPDLLIMRGAWFRDQGKVPNSLLRNNGNGTFTDVTIQAGIYTKRPTQNAVWLDFDLDGWVDLFIGNESIPENGADFNFPSELYHNQKDGTFKEVSASAGLQINTFVKGSTGGDINNDGYPDLYISVLNGQNRLFLNQSDASGIKFKDISATANVGEPYVSFPTWMFDYNNDGWLDIFVSAYSDGSDDLPGKVLRAYGKKDDPFRPRLYRNNANGTFTDMSMDMGLTEPVFSMGSNYGDLDNDGFLDFYLGTGEPNLKSVVPNKMYRNREGKYYDDVTYAGGFGNIQKGHGVAFGDMDMDGDQDLYVVMGGSFEGDVYQNIFFENPNTNGNRWIVLRLEGVKSNRLALDARVEIEITENGTSRKIYDMVGPGSSFGGNSLQLEIGLGKAEKINAVKIYWPVKGGQPQELSGLQVNKAYRIKEGENAVEVNYPYTAFKKDAHTGHQH